MTTSRRTTGGRAFLGYGPALRWLVFAAAIAAWQGAARLAPPDERLFFPPPTRIAAQIGRLWLSGSISHLYVTPTATGEIGPSMGRMLTGWGLAVVVGVAAGVLFGRWEAGHDVVDPVIQFLRAVPLPALIPAFIVLFKIGDAMHVAVIAFGAVWPILLNTIDGARSVDPMHLDLARVFRLTRTQRLRLVVIPSAGPKIFSGLRVSLSLSLIIMALSEMVGSTSGIGFSLMRAQDSFEVTTMWADVVLLGFIGYVLNGLLLWLERRLLGWQPNPEGSR